ncbi:MAG: hypothetical protein QME94_02960, partial [Anaerolineae bacterium]|nr:hypothetical protein [Anaerolineae bacterium]
ERQIGIEELEDWLAPRLLRFFQSPSSPDARMAAKIELGLAELDDGTITEDELRERLRDALRQQSTVALFVPRPPETEASAASETSDRGTVFTPKPILTTGAFAAIETSR